jgi:hypothetical protein
MAVDDVFLKRGCPCHRPSPTPPPHFRMKQSLPPRESWNTPRGLNDIALHPGIPSPQLVATSIDNTSPHLHLRQGGRRFAHCEPIRLPNSTPPRRCPRISGQQPTFEDKPAWAWLRMGLLDPMLHSTGRPVESCSREPELSWAASIGKLALLRGGPTELSEDADRVQQYIYDPATCRLMMAPSCSDGRYLLIMFWFASVQPILSLP